MWIGIVLTALVAMLITMVQHWFPWKEVLKKELPRPAAYALGTLAILVPATIFMAIEPAVGSCEAIATLWAAAAGAGLGTMVGYLVDSLLGMKIQLSAAQFEAQHLRPQVGEDKDAEGEG